MNLQIDNIKKKKNNKPESKSQNFANIKSIKIPEIFEEKEKLLQGLKNSICDIDAKMKNLMSKRQYYTEIVEVLEKEIKERNLSLLNRNNINEISVIQEELYSKL